MVVLGKRGLGNDEVRRVIEHAFLPPKLPESKSRTLVTDEANLLELWTNVILESFYTNLIPMSTKNLFKVWEDIQSAHVPTAEKISKAISELDKDGMFGFYVRGQNAAIMLSMSTSTLGTISTFPASLKSSTIMACNDLVSSYPEQSITIPKSEVLGSLALARQLVTLTTQTMVHTLEAQNGGAEIRDVPDTVYISEWLASVLSNRHSKLDSEFPTICKKVRDNVSRKEALIPFRRSGMLMSVKVILQLSLLRSRGKLYQAQDCLVLYKIIMAESLRKICEAGDSISLEPDIGIFMMKKLARRVMKIKKLTCTSVELKRAIEVLHRNSSTTIRTWKNKMTVEWKQRIERGSAILKPLIVNHGDVIHKQLPNIPKMDNLNTGCLASNEMPTCFPRHRVNQPDMPNVPFLVKGLESKALENILFDIEAWILHNMNARVGHSHLRQFCINYVRTAAPFYKKSFNPIGASRMILAFLKIVATMDHIAVTKYPLLLEHRVGVSCEIFEQLLLPLRSDLELAHKLEQYFSNRDRKANYPSLIEEDVITQRSFSVRYADGNEEMCELRDKILADAEDTIKGKLGEVKEAKRACANLRQEIHSLSCTGRLNHRGPHIESCAKCHTVEFVDKYRVDVYERPLRNEPEKRLAVVFELLIPPEIACFRDVLTLVLSDICNAKKTAYKIEDRIWTDYFQIAQYDKGDPMFFQLGSTTKSFVDTYYKDRHPDFPEADFIVDNNYDCTFKGTFFKTWNVKNYCTFGIPKYSVYSILDWTLKTTSHTQNQVLAKQSECPHEIRLSEYKEFGSLRAGHRLQLRNILRSLIEKSLSLKEEAVFTLICQALWEAGPQVEGDLSWSRDSHADFVNQKFTEKFLKELKNLLRTYEHNWAEPYTLLTTTVLACRVLEFGLVNKEATELILQCRRTAFDWIKRIESKLAIAYETDSPLSHKQDLKMKLVDACICLCWTYSVGEPYLDGVLASPQDLFYWLHAMTRIYNNITSSTTTKLSHMKTLLLRQVQNIALNIEPKLINYRRTGFDIFVKENWNEATTGVFEGWMSFPSPAEQVYHTKFRRPDRKDVAHIQVDVLRGSFLINGFPVGYLSESITKHPLFSRTFKNIVFEVRPAVEPNTFITTHEFNNAFYLFTLLSDGTTLIVRERRATGEEFQLIPHFHMNGIIPLLLVQGYSHWFNVAKNSIDFRPVCFEDFRKQVLPTFQLNIRGRKLTEVTSGREMFYLLSSTHMAVLSFLSRLEHQNYIHTFLDSSSVTGDPDVIVELPRMNLHFKYNKKECTLDSLEYNMTVRMNQNINTLIGLENGLVLENNFNDLKVLMPHGGVSIHTPYTHAEHQRIQIQLEELKKPALFTFDLDTRLQKLRAGKTCTGWLYLAYLHARTSSALTDPFTGLTGTESTFNILQSGHAWSCKPYDDESMAVLDAIRKLSPVREYYPSHLKCMEHVTWPDGLPVSASHDGFRLIVDKLVADSLRLKPLFQKSGEDDDDEKDVSLDENVVFLTHRAYLRYEALCSQELRISHKFCEIPVPEIYTKIAEYGRGWITKSDWIQNTRNLADLGNSWTFATPGCISLKPFLVAEHNSLHGRMTSRTVLSKMSIIELQTLDIRNTWIDMYEMARDVGGSDLKPEWVLLLTTLAFRGVDVHQLMLLHCVAVQRVFFQAQEPPQVAKYINPFKYTFDETEVLGTMHLPSRTSEAINQASVLVLLLKTLWPMDSCTSDTFEKLPRNCVNVQFSDLNAKLKNWNTNRKLVEFLGKVEATTSILPGSVPLVYSGLARANFVLLIKTYISSKLALTDFSDMLKEPKIDVDTINIFNNKNTGSPYTAYEGAALYASLRDQKLAIDKRVEDTYQWIKECFVFPETELLYQSDLVKLTPTFLLRRLLDSTKADQNVHSLIGALGVLWTLQQRVNRCLLYFSMEGAGKVQLYREQENPGHENWVPADHPECRVVQLHGMAPL